MMDLEEQLQLQRQREQRDYKDRLGAGAGPDLGDANDYDDAAEDPVLPRAVAPAAETAPPPSMTDPEAPTVRRPPPLLSPPPRHDGSSLADSLRSTTRSGGSLVDDGSFSEPETPPSEEDYDENIRPSLTQPPPSTLRRRQQLPATEATKGTVATAAIQRSDSGVHIIPDDDKSIQAFLERSSQRARDRQEGANKPSSSSSPGKLRNLVFTRQFTTFDRNNEEAVNSPFHGFYNLFWLGVALFIARIWAENWRAYGNPMGGNEIVKTMFSGDLFVLLLSDGILVALTGVTSMIQLLVHDGYLDWNRSGWIIQHIWQTCFFATFVSWTQVRDWPWTHSIFFVLHGLTLLMKQHSYAFYNGHLSAAHVRRRYVLKKLELLDGADRRRHLAQEADDENDDQEDDQNDAPPGAQQSVATTGSRHRRHYSFRDTEESDIDDIAKAIASRRPLDDDQVRIFERILKWEISTLTEELRGTASSAKKAYPDNLGLVNFYRWIPLPTVVYEIEYPRSRTIDWWYVAEKMTAMIGVIFVMIQVSQHYIFVRAMLAKEQDSPLSERLQEFPWIFMDLMFPLASEYLLTWYLLWETILNVLAELTYFADRRFYDDWWNSVSWDQFARSWNIPVHNFLLRHVYHSSISSLKVRKHTATLITFTLSACVHELLMWCLFKKFRGYLFMAQMSQLPLVKLSRTRWLKGHRTLGNVLFWLGLFTGPGVLCSLYLVV